MALQITWINKPGGGNNPVTHIIEVGGPNWRKAAPAVIRDILNGSESYLVSQGEKTVGVALGIHNGYYYLRTRTDFTPIDNLLSLTNIAVV